MRIVVISLNDKLDRRESAARQFSQHGLEFEFFDALNGEEAVKGGHFEFVDEERWILHTGREMAPGELGCFASHRSVWQQIVDSGEPIMIMEDDFLLLDRFAEAVDLAANLVGTYGFVRLQSIVRVRQKTVKKLGDFDLIRYTKAPHCMMCYTLSPKVAAVFLEQTRHICDPVDYFCKRFWDHKQPMYALLPYTVTDSEHSPDTGIGGRKKARKSVATRVYRTGVKLKWFIHRNMFNRGYRDPA